LEHAGHRATEETIRIPFGLRHPEEWDPSPDRRDSHRERNQTSEGSPGILRIRQFTGKPRSRCDAVLSHSRPKRHSQGRTPGMDEESQRSQIDNELGPHRSEAAGVDGILELLYSRSQCRTLNSYIWQKSSARLGQSLT